MKNKTRDNLFKIFSMKYEAYILETLRENDYPDIFCTKSYSDYSYLKLSKKYKKVINEDYCGLIKTLYYTKIKESLSDNNIANTLDNVKNFGYYIRYAEKCYMYQNADTSEIFSETVKNKPDDIIVYFKWKDYKVKISFESTKIPNIANIIDDSENISFVNIEIVRNFGKQMCNTFRFVPGEESTLKNNLITSDDVLLYKVCNDINRSISNTYDKILDSIIPNFTHGCVDDTTTYWKEVITDGLWIRK